MGAGVTWAAIIVAAGVIFLLTLGGPRPPARPGPSRVLLVGDSLAVGLLVPLGADLKARGVHFATGAKGSTTAAFWQTRLSFMLADHRPQLVIFSLGTNDCRDEAGRACAEFRERTRDLAEQCSQAGARALFLIPGWVSWSPRIAERLTLGADAWTYAGPIDLQPDRIHPTAPGYHTWAAALTERLYP